MVEKLAQVVETLTAGGIRARRGYPAEKYFFPETPVAAVNLHTADGDVLVIAAEIYAQRAEDCENAAWQAMTLLTQLGTSCSAGGCQYQRMMGLYSQRVLIRWEGAEQTDGATLGFKLYRNGTLLPYVTGFSAVCKAELYQVTGEDGSASVMRQSPVWEVTVEEQIPVSVAPQVDPDGEFTLEINRQGGGEVFPKCQWDSVKRMETQRGVHQVRVAKTWANRVVNGKNG